jgi:hypothetical protein
MMSMLTPTKSEVDHMKTSLFLLRKDSSSACSYWLTSAPMHTILSETLGSSGTFLKSPSTSMAFLHFARASTLWGLMKVLCCSDSSHKKFTFLWSGVKPLSMFLASC